MSVIRDSIRQELTLAVNLSTEYSSKVKFAKTKTKSNYYSKKLKKNNNLIANMIISLDKIEKSGYNAQKLDQLNK